MMKPLMRSIWGVIGFAVLLVPGGALAQTSDYVASLEPVAGVVQHQPADADPADPQSWQTITEPVLVEEGDRIRTSVNGFAYLTFFEGIETEIRGNTLAVVSTLIFPDEVDPNFTISLDVLAGTTVSNVEVVLDSQDRFEVFTPSASAVVRGTRWWTLVATTGSTFFASETGMVGVIPHPRLARPAIVVPSAPPPGTESEQQPAAPAYQPPEPIVLAPGMGLRTNSLGEVEETVDGLVFPAGQDMTFAPLAPATCGDGICQDDEADVCALDCQDPNLLPGCGDGVCTPDQGEGLLSCPSDCGPWPGENCGDDTCDADESFLTCPADCAAGQYYTPVQPGLCGNGMCEVTETALTCPADCRPSAANEGPREACTATGNNVYLRLGPGNDFLAAGVMYAGNTVTLVGRSEDGAWYLLDREGIQIWLEAARVTLSGDCERLPVVVATPVDVSLPPDQPDQPDQPEDTGTDQPPTGPGTWGECGSCSYCGPYPRNECVTAPDGSCLWDPATCRTPVDSGRLTVPQGVYTCSYGSSFSVVATYQPASNAVISSRSASSSGFDVIVTGTAQIGALQVRVDLNCMGSPGAVNTITVSITDTNAETFSTQFDVQLY